MLHLLQSKFTPPCTVLASVPFFPIALGVAPSKFDATAHNAVAEPTDFSYCHPLATPLSTSTAPSNTFSTSNNAPCNTPSNTTSTSSNTPSNATSSCTSNTPCIATSNNEALSNHIALSIESNLTKPQCSIDSMQIWIPVECRSIGKRQFEKQTPIKLIDCSYDKTLLKDSWVLASTGEVVREHPAYLHNDKHLSYQTGYAFKYIISGNQAVNYISIGLHSKLLGTDYFKSITNETIYRVWQTIIEQGVINITYENFLQCYVHQVDLKTDSIQDDVNASLDLIEANIREGRSFKRFDKEMNQGIQVGNRKDNTPSIHFYNKALQFLNDTRSSIFLEKVLRFNHPSNILRTEITLYARQLYEDFEIEGDKGFHPSSQMNLATILSKLDSHGRQTMTKYLNKIFNPQQVNKVKPLEKEPNDKGLSDQVKIGVELCLTSSMTLEETEITICRLLQPGRDKKREVLRLTRHFYTVQSKAIDLDDEVKEIINF